MLQSNEFRLAVRADPVTADTHEPTAQRQNVVGQPMTPPFARQLPAGQRYLPHMLRRIPAAICAKPGLLSDEFTSAGTGKEHKSLLLSWLSNSWRGVGLVFILALLVRLYKLSYHPLWLDELYGYQLGQLGVGGIVRNSLIDPHPPLYYFIQWVAAGAGFLQHEGAWRWLSALSGACTVALVYHLARMRVSPISAALACGLFAVSPMHLFYSQEARSFAFVTLLAAITMLLLYYLHQSSRHTALWAGHFGVSLVGMYCSYNFVLVTSMQLLYLAIIEGHWRPTLRYALLFGMCCMPLVLPFWMTLSSVAAQHTTSPSTNLFAILQALVGGDLIRYSFSWRHLWLLGVLSLLAFAGMGFRPASGSRTFTFYYVVQCILPVALFFGIFAPLFGVNLILTEAKQFMVLLPAWFVLVAQGTEQVWHINPARLIRSVLVGAYTIALIASIISLQRYWETPKSPEGLAVLHVRDQKQPDDAVISLHYSLDAALSFYMPETTSYTKPQQHEDGYLFTNDTYVLPVQLLEDQIEPSISLATIQNHPRIWVLSHSGKSPDMVQAIAQDCVVGGEWTYRPFRVTLLHSCTSSS